MNEGTRAEYDGHEVCLWPLEYVGITGTPSSSNHTVIGVTNSGLYDNGWYITPIRSLYAPVTMQLKFSYPSGSSNGHTQVWQSLNKVWLPGYPNPEYVTIGFSHSDNLYYTNIGTIIPQGTHFYDTGTFGLGDGGAHVHMILYIGTRGTMFPTGINATYGNIWYSDNPPDTIADFFYILPSDEIRNTAGYDFTVYNGSITHGSIKQLILYTQLFKRRAKNGKRIYT